MKNRGFCEGVRENRRDREMITRKEGGQWEEKRDRNGEKRSETEEKKTNWEERAR